MKLYLFLDIDGVLNHKPVTEDCDDALELSNDPTKNWKILCPRCIDRLNQLIRETYSHYDKTEIIVSSTWRRLLTIEEFNFTMACAGFEFEISGFTEISCEHRGQQIKNYLQWRENRDGPEDCAYLVIDDDTHDMDLVKDNQVVTSYKSGFDNRALNEAFKLIMEIRDHETA